MGGAEDAEAVEAGEAAREREQEQGAPLKGNGGL